MPIFRSSLAACRRAAPLVLACALAACAEYLGTSFSQIAPPELGGREPQPGGQCWLETVNGVQPGEPWQVSRQRRVVFRGWALDGATLSTSVWLVVRLRNAGGRYYAVTWARANREDVGRALGKGPGIAQAGFELIGTLQQVPPGTYDIDLVIGVPTGPVLCPSGRKLVDF